MRDYVEAPFDFGHTRGTRGGYAGPLSTDLCIWGPVKRRKYRSSTEVSRCN